MAEGLPRARLAWTWGAATAALAFALDQATKWWVLTHLMDPPRVIPVTPFFNLVLGWNRGVSFGLLSADHPATPWLLSSLALAVVVGFYVISGVHHALHTPLMSVTNAISGIIVVGALLQIGQDDALVTALAFVAILVASINVFGGFAVTRRMLGMFTRGPSTKVAAR